MRRSHLLLAILCLALSWRAQGAEDPAALVHEAVLAGNAAELERLLRLHPSAVHARGERGARPLHLAAAVGDVAIARILIARGASLDASFEHGATPLLVAAGSGHTQVARLLLERGANIAVSDESGVTALHGAVAAGQVEMVDLLLAAGAPVNLSEHAGLTPLDYALAKQDVPALAEKLRAKGARTSQALAPALAQLWDAVRADDAARLASVLKSEPGLHHLSVPTGGTLLHLCARENKPAAAEALLAAGLGPDLRDGLERTALHLAARSGSERVAAHLLTKGANPLLRDHDGKLPLQLAFEEGHTGIAGALLDRMGAAGKQELLVHVAVRLDRRDLLDFALERGFPVDARDTDGATALHLAAELNREGLAMRLLEAGANPNAQLVRGQSVLHVAAERSSVSLLQALLARGADPKALAQDMTPLDVAVMARRAEAAAVLKQSGSPLSQAHGKLAAFVQQGNYEGTRLMLSIEPGLAQQPDKEGATPLHLAAIKGNAAIVGLLLGKGAPPNAAFRGSTPLLLAALSGDPASCRLLLDAGASVTARATSGGTPLHAAVLSKNAEVVTLLLDKGADVNVKDAQGRTPLDVALDEAALNIGALLRTRGAKQGAE